jgi:hypothetical protein
MQRDIVNPARPSARCFQPFGFEPDRLGDHAEQERLREHRAASADQEPKLPALGVVVREREMP